MAVNLEFKHVSKRVAVTPAMTLFQAVEAARPLLKLPPSSQFTVTHRGRPVEMSIPFRLTGISNNATLELHEAASVGGDGAQQVRVAVQTLEGKRVQQSFASDCTLEAILTACNQLPPVSGQSFSVTYMQREITFDAFASTTLKDLGIPSGSAMFRMQRAAGSSAPSNSTAAAARSVTFAVPTPMEIDEETKESGPPPMAMEIDEETKESGPPPMEFVQESKGSGSGPPPASPSAISRPPPVIQPGAPVQQHQQTTLAPVIIEPETRTIETEQLSSHDALQLLRDSSFDAVSRVAITTLMKIVTNILSHPENEKMRSIRVSNAAFHRNVGQHRGGLDFLKSLGFKLDDDGDRLVLASTEQANSLLLRGLQLLEREADDLQISEGDRPKVVVPVVPDPEFDAFKPVITRIQAQPRGPSATEVLVDNLKAKQEQLLQQVVIPPRNTTVQFPGQLAVSLVATSSDDDVEMATADRSDASLVIASMKARRVEMEKAQNFRTQAMRDLDELKRKKVFQQALIRVQFPDRVIIQAAFHPSETVADVMNHVRDCLDATAASNASFYLYVSPPLQKLAPEKTLSELGLVPAAHTYLSWIDPPTASASSSTEFSGWYLRQDLLTPDQSDSKASDASSATAYPNSIALDEDEAAKAAKAARAAAADAALKRSTAGESKGTKTAKKPSWLKL